MADDKKKPTTPARVHLPGEDVPLFWCVGIAGVGLTLGILGWFLEFKPLLLLGLIGTIAGGYLVGAKIWKWYNTPATELVGDVGSYLVDERNSWGKWIFGDYWHEIKDEKDPVTGKYDCKIVHSKIGIIPVAGAADFMQWLGCKFSD